jgi:MFS family permease
MDDRLMHLPTRIARPESVGAVLGHLKDGLRYVRQTELVLLAVVVMGTVATVGMNFSVLIPAFAADDLHSDAAGFGFLMAASGIGSLLASVRLVFGGRPRPLRLVTGALLLGAASVALALTRTFPLAMAFMLVSGFGSVLMAATANTTIQLAVPDHLRGRVMSVYTTVFSASVPIGGLAMGAIASSFGVTLAIGLGGVLTLLIAFGALLWGRGRTLEAVSIPQLDARASGTVPGGVRTR